MIKPAVYYESFGCQMNAYDTEVIESLMRASGFRTVPRPENADVIIVNTCSVREHAEQRAIGRLNDLSRHSARLVVCGCMAQRMGDDLFKKVAGLAIISGPDNYRELPAAVSETLGGGNAVSLLGFKQGNTYQLLGAGHRSGISRFVSVTRGCDNYCSYCIVPYLRGSIRSKQPERIMEEIRACREKGAREITLLGQNVMAYRYGEVDFVALLKMVLEGSDLPRIRFLTTHPRDIDQKIFLLMRDDA
nr:radical SAM protein [Candidatus Krumholzibacteriota bacterium]